MNDDMKALHAALDAIALTPQHRRRVSGEQTEECPSWNSMRGYWEETDDLFRERIKKAITEGTYA